MPFLVGSLLVFLVWTITAFASPLVARRRASKSEDPLAARRAEKRLSVTTLVMGPLLLSMLFPPCREPVEPPCREPVESACC